MILAALGLFIVLAFHSADCALSVIEGSRKQNASIVKPDKLDSNLLRCCEYGDDRRYALVAAGLAAAHGYGHFADIPYGSSRQLDRTKDDSG